MECLVKSFVSLKNNSNYTEDDVRLELELERLKNENPLGLIVLNNKFLRNKSAINILNGTEYLYTKVIDSHLSLEEIAKCNFSQGHLNVLLIFNNDQKLLQFIRSSYAFEDECLCFNNSHNCALTIEQLKQLIWVAKLNCIQDKVFVGFTHDAQFLCLISLTQ